MRGLFLMVFSCLLVSGPIGCAFPSQEGFSPESTV